MPKTTKILCDNCGADITSTGNSVDWRVALLNQQIPSRGGIVTDMWITPQLKEDAYFCSSVCLRVWVIKEIVPPNLKAYDEALKVDEFQNSTEAPAIDLKDDGKEKSPEDNPDFHTPGSDF